MVVPSASGSGVVIVAQPPSRLPEILEGENGIQELALPILSFLSRSDTGNFALASKSCCRTVNSHAKLALQLRIESNGKITDADFVDLVKYGFCFTSDKVTKLDLQNSKITDAQLGLIFAHFPNIQEVTLSYCNRITDAGLALSGPLPNLRSLKLATCPHMTDAGLEHLGPTPMLEELSLMNSSISSNGLAHLGQTPNLRHITFFECPEIQDNGLAHLGPTPLLNELQLRSCPGVTHQGVAHLGPLPNLECLHLCECSEQIVFQLGPKPKLSHLRLLGEQFSGNC